ncbi:MAG: DinB family protein [Saprospiraceae bacterium]
MKSTNAVLIEDLIQRTKQVLNDTMPLLALEESVLNQKVDATAWSVLECIAHLNYYGDFYLPEIKQRIQNAPVHVEEQVFKSGWLGNYFSNSMLPKAKLNKMKTFASMNPVGSKLDKSILSKFVEQQKEMLDLLHSARRISLTKTKTAISLTKWIQLRLGDTFRVVIYHNQRHLVQAQKALQHAQSNLAQQEKVKTS